MSQRFFGIYPVSDQLLQFLYLWKPTFSFSIKPRTIIYTNLISAADCTWHQHNPVYIFRKGRQDLLSHVCGTEQPSTFGAILYFYSRFHLLKITNLRISPENNASLYNHLHQILTFAV